MFGLAEGKGLLYLNLTLWGKIDNNSLLSDFKAEVAKKIKDGDYRPKKTNNCNKITLKCKILPAESFMSLWEINERENHFYDIQLCFW